ncbi:MAG: DUF4012 domain-containing protein [Actinobacteria bacterium]|nr:DUF4012 domain-containing protein [Actinomycetota bacterium]
MLRPVSHARGRLSRRVRHPRYYVRFWVLAGLAALVVLAVGAVAWVGVRALSLRPVATDLVSDAQAFKRQVAGGDLDAAAVTLGRLRVQSARAHDLTDDPAWALVAHAPVVGKDVAAARTLTAVAADLTAATEPLESTLPALGGGTGARSRIDLVALGKVAATLPAVSHAVDDGLAALQGVETDTTVPQLGDGVTQLRSMLDTARGPVHSAGPSLEVLTTLLGGNGPRTYVVLMQQDAEARGTGGLVGSFAVIGAKNGDISLKSVASRPTLQNGLKIPVNAVPEDVADLWGPDLQEWAGLNLSPHYPWTGRLVAAGWAAQGRPKIDGVIAVDQYVVAGMLQATGPLTVSGVTIDAGNAVSFLSKDVYARFPNYLDVDRVTGELVAAVFQKVAAGQVSPAGLAKALIEPARQRRVLVWAADPAEQRLIETTSLGGVVPDRPGPFAMAVVNNGGGNKLDAYLKTAVRYDPGTCTDGVRIGSVTVALASTAPKAGLPAYVVAAPDLTGPADRTVTEPTRVLLDVYGPVGATNAGVLVDGKDAEVLAEGIDRNHPVWRVAVMLPPGGKRTVEVGVVQPTSAEDTPTATVLTQPMANPAKVTVAPLTPCS